MAWTPPADFTHGEVVTATKLNTHLRDNMKEVWRRVGYTEFVADVTGSGTEAAPTDIVSAGAITLAAVPSFIECYVCTAVGNGSGLNLWDGSTDLGRLVDMPSGGVREFRGMVKRHLTPTAASHTYKLRGWGSVAVEAGAGGAGVTMPGYIAVWQKGGA